MFLNSVILTLVEILEATVIISCFLALSQRYQIRRVWSLWAIISGILGSACYGRFMGEISMWGDGLGQEISNALILFVIIISLGFAMIKIIKIHHQQEAKGLCILMVITSMLSISREGSEIYLFITGFILNQDLLFNVLMGVSLGAGVGFSIGAIIYFFLIQIPMKYTLPFTLTIFSLLGAGISIRAVQLLIQADLLPSQSALWDSSFILSESSITGQLLHSISGYESSPSFIELGSFLLTLCVLGGISYRSLYRQHT